MARCILVAAAVLGLLGPAAAQMRYTSDQTSDGWKIRSYENPSVPDQGCVFLSPPEKAYVAIWMVLKLPPDGALGTAVSIGNPAWSFSTGTSGRARVTIGGAPKDLDFVFVNEHELMSRMPSTSENSDWAGKMMESQDPIGVSIPDVGSFSVDVPNIGGQFLMQACSLKLVKRMTEGK